VRTLIVFSLVGLAGLALVVFVAPRLVDPAVARAMTAAMVICFSVAVLALAVPAIVAPRRPDMMIEAGLAAMIIRLFLTLICGYAYLRYGDPPRQAFMTSMVVCYSLFLAIETFATLRLVRRYWKPPQTR
jgi:hypothetical protein